MYSYTVVPKCLIQIGAEVSQECLYVIFRSDGLLAMPDARSRHVTCVIFLLCYVFFNAKPSHTEAVWLIHTHSSVKVSETKCNHNHKTDPNI